MIENLETDSFRSSFGHCIVKWEIKNYRDAIFTDHWQIESPDFAVRGPESQKTKWKLIFHLHPVVDDDTVDEEFRHRSANFRLHLERSRYDEGPETVYVEWKTSSINLRKVKCPVAHEKLFFNHGDNHDIPTGVYFDFGKSFGFGVGDTTFICQMIVYDPNTTFLMSDIDSSLNINLCALSEDLQEIFEEEKFCDLVIEVGKKKWDYLKLVLVDEKKFHVHKAMLSSRCVELKKMIAGDDSGVIKLPELDYDGVHKILGYIYSGDILKISGKPSISMYETAAFLNLTNITKLYAPEELSISTKVNVYFFAYDWYIKNFSKKIQNNCLTSMVLADENFSRLKSFEIGPEWRIHLYPRGMDGDSEYIAIYLECLCGPLYKDICVDFAVKLGKDKGYVNWKTFQRSEKPEMMFGDESFIKRETLLKLLKDDKLKLAFKVRMRKSIDYSVDYTEHLEIPYDKQEELHFLANKMNNVCNSNDFTDVVLCSGEEEIKAHKFVLSARSLMLSDMLKNDEDRLVLSNIKPDVLKLIKRYMYCASLHETNIETLLDVYVAAEDLLIPHLKEKCLQVLLMNLKVDTVCDVLSFSDDIIDAPLKEVALKFISSNNIAVFEQHKWHELKLRKPLLCNEVEEFLKAESSTEKRLAMMSLNDANIPDGSRKNDSKEVKSLGDRVLVISDFDYIAEGVSSEQPQTTMDIDAECSNSNGVDTAENKADKLVLDFPGVYDVPLNIMQIIKGEDSCNNGGDMSSEGVHENGVDLRNHQDLNGEAPRQCRLKVLTKIPKRH